MWKGTPLAAVVAPSATWDDAPVEPTLGTWFADEYAKLLRFAYLVCGAREDAHDAVQECYVRMHQAGVDVNRAGLSSYARQTIVNLQRRRWQRDRRHRDVVHLLVEPSEATSPSPPDDDLDDAITSLSRRHRAVLVLRFHEDRTESDIASILGITAGSVKQHLPSSDEVARVEIEHGGRVMTRLEEQVRTRLRARASEIEPSYAEDLHAAEERLAAPVARHTWQHRLLSEHLLSPAPSPRWLW